VDEAVEARLFEPRDSRNRALAGSSWAISASIAPHMRTAWLPLRRLVFLRLRCRVAGGEAGFVDVGDVELGLAVMRKSSRV